MEVSLRDWFLARWGTYFDGAELPIAFYYTDREDTAQAATPPAGHRCLIAALSQVRKGKPLRFDAGSVGCGGAKRYLGFSEERSCRTSNTSSHQGSPEGFRESATRSHRNW